MIRLRFVVLTLLLPLLLMGCPGAMTVNELGIFDDPDQGDDDSAAGDDDDTTGGDDDDTTGGDDDDTAGGDDDDTAGGDDDDTTGGDDDDSDPGPIVPTDCGPYSEPDAEWSGKPSRTYSGSATISAAGKGQPWDWTGCEVLRLFNEVCEVVWDVSGPSVAYEDEGGGAIWDYELTFALNEADTSCTEQTAKNQAYQLDARYYQYRLNFPNWAWSTLEIDWANWNSNDFDEWTEAPFTHAGDWNWIAFDYGVEFQEW